MSFGKKDIRDLPKRFSFGGSVGSFVFGWKNGWEGGMTEDEPTGLKIPGKLTAGSAGRKMRGFGSGKGNGTLQKWQFLVSMLDFWSVLSMKYRLFNRDPYFIVYEIIPT